MATSRTDFLKFSAYSMKDLITRKLSEDSNFTDQIYEGSNLAILIDIVSYMYQCLIYNINNAAAESMFSDTQIYENINRLCKFIGYNPKGCSPSNCLVSISTKNTTSGDSIPKYSYVDTKKIDSNGNKVFYSFIEDFALTSQKVQYALLYNGIWKRYNQIFTSTGEEYQTFILENLKSDSDNEAYVPTYMINVYVYDGEKYTEYKLVDQGLFTDNNIYNGTYIYSNDSTGRIFNIRLNENKQYEISFGNGRTGVIPPKDSMIYVLYLQTNGPGAEVSLKELDNLKVEFSRTYLNINNDLFSQLKLGSIFDTADGEEQKSATITNISKSSEFIPEESVDDIRRNAPEWFKTGNRLVTADDYTFYVRNRFKDNIVDVVCQNNWEYISSFYKWLYNLGINGKYRHNNQQYYINQAKFAKYDYKYADAADSNNVYLWIKMKNDSDVYKTVIDKEVRQIKMLTQESVFLTPITVYFTPCALDVDRAFEILKTGKGLFTTSDEKRNSYIEVTVDDNVVYTNINIQKNIKDIIIDFFDEKKQSIGQFVNLAELTDRIYNLGIISRIRTVYTNTENNEVISVPGLSFASWSSQIVDVGEDLDISTSGKTLESFQFPSLYESSQLLRKIVVVRKMTNMMSVVQY